MPRCFSMSIQSEVANLPVFLPFTVPALESHLKQQQFFGQRGFTRVRVGDDGKRAAAAHLVEDFLGHGFLCKKVSGRFFRRPEGYGCWKTG